MSDKEDSPRWDPEGDGWPHPSRWVDDLVSKLEPNIDIYTALKQAASGHMSFDEQDELEAASISAEDLVAGQQDAAIRTLTVVMDALQQLPALRKPNLLLPMHDLLQALGNLSLGHSTKLLQPPSKARNGQDKLGGMMVKIWAVISFRVLVSLDPWKSRKKQARQLVEAEFTRSNWEVSARNLENWASSRSTVNRVGEKLIASTLATLRASPEWPYSETRARTFVRDIARSPRLAQYRYQA